MPEKRVIVAIPTLNEATHISRVIAEIHADPAADEIWVIDGGSTDGTVECILEWQRHSERVGLMHNPARRQAAALNLAARQAALIGATILVRADAHAHYPDGFVGKVCAVLSRREADSVVVPLIARVEEGTAWQQAAAHLQHSWLGHGGARHRMIGRSGWVDHGHHAAFRLDEYLAVGGYDDRFLAAEDVDFDWRLAAARGRIWLEADTPVDYVPRSTARELFRQMARNGRARCQVALKHRRRLGPRQILPAVVTAALMLSVALAPVIGPPAALPALIYGATTVGMPHLNWSTVMFRKRRTENGEQAAQAGGNSSEVEAG